MSRDKSTVRTLSPARTQAGTDLQGPLRATVTALETAFADHSARHENGGADELNLAGLNGVLADPQTPIAHKVSHQNGGADEINVVGLSGLLADRQTPEAHASSHEDGGADVMNVTDLIGLLATAQTPIDHAAEHAAAGGDPLNVTTLSGYPGGATTFLRDDGSFAAVPTAGASGSFTTVDGKTVTVVNGLITAIV